MNRKGFTLVEVLAVLILVSVLLMFIIPNVVGRLSDAKKELFYNNILKIYSGATESFLADSTRNRFCEGEDTFLKKLNISVSNIHYDILVDNMGAVTSIKASDGKFFYQLNQEGPINKSQITIDDIEENSESLKCTSGSYDIVFTDYTLDGKGTNIAYNTLYNALGNTYDADIKCQNGSIYTYENGKISVQELVLPDYCVVDFTTK